ncbi:MAG TPA: T9SS type A sorting domain-containing protein, partial [Chitinophagales bacterium]|nr:T9SS type A sorting domain-containing protein [Chitinophagales bacterium]
NSVDTTILHQTPVHTDVAVTALHHLIYDTGINPGTQPSWNLDGKSWLVDPNSTGIKQVADKPDFKIYPNPASGIVAVYFENDNKYTPYVNIYNTIGQKVNAPYSILSPNKLNIDVSELANGIYTVNIRVGNTEKSEQLVVSK